jgi:hypothetical protein
MKVNKCKKKLCVRRKFNRDQIFFDILVLNFYLLQNKGMMEAQK